MEIILFGKGRKTIRTTCLLVGILCALQRTGRTQTISKFDVLVATETLTVVGTTTLQGNAFSVGVSSFIVSQGNVGIATAAPAGLFTVGNGTITVLNSGLIGIGTTTPNGLLDMDGTATQPMGGNYPARFRWISSLGAMRAGGGLGGTATAVDDDLANVGFFSYTFGVDQFNDGVISTIGGGEENTVVGGSAVIGGGQSNTISVNGGESVIAGGFNNDVFNGYGVIGGGFSNTISGYNSTISGGRLNTAEGDYSTIPGGYSNTASGRYSFAAGQQSSATAQGSFVWADSQNTALVSNTTDEFRIRAGGGYVLLSTPTAPTIIVSSGSILISTSAAAVTAVPNLYISSVTGNVGVGTKSPQATLDVNGSAQFGSGATKSTFTSTPGGAIYALQLSSGISLAAGGIKWADGSISTTAASGSGGGGGQAYTTVSTATSGISSTFPQRSTIAFDSTYFTATDSGTATVVSLRQTFGAGHTRTYLLSGSGTYTTPSGASSLFIRMVAGGGGGGSSQTGTTDGSNGSASYFSSVVASSGMGGFKATGSQVLAGGAGGSGGSGTASLRIAGGAGGYSGNWDAGSVSGYGGNSAFGGGGFGGVQGAATTLTGGAGATNSGAGGGGGTNGFNGGGGSGGGAGEYVEISISSPTASYSYSVGSGGAGGTGTGSGGAGGSGEIIVDEYYPPIAAVSPGALITNTTSSFYVPAASTITFGAGSSISGLSVSTCGYIPSVNSFKGGTSFASVVGSSLTWTSHGGYPRVVMKSHFLAWDIRVVTCLEALIDSGTNGTRTLCWESAESPSGGSNGDFTFDALWTQTIPSGLHTVQLYYKTANANGVQIPQALAGEDGNQLCVYDNQ